jgi:two-component system, CAI-1 autoinducer sensor kinase/phosphatase CqsS
MSDALPIRRKHPALQALRRLLKPYHFRWTGSKGASASGEPWLRWRIKDLVLAPLEPILHASPERLWWLGLFIFAGQALYGWIWSALLPQAYENLPLRAVASLLGLSLMLRRINGRYEYPLAQAVFTLVFWLDLPVLFIWMYLCNGGSAMWLASVAVMVLIYYHVTDWRLATLGTASGGLLAFAAFHFIGPVVHDLPADQYLVHGAVFAFAWVCALVLSLSSADLRRAQLAHTLATMGIMAHELRTPLSTAALLGDAIQMEVQRQGEHPRAPQIDKLAIRLHALVRNMNHQIDAQIANARLLQLPRQSERVDAGELVRQVVDQYPYASSRQRDCVRLSITGSFVFRSSGTQFAQVLDNLIKNAFHSLMVADSRYPPGALRIEVRSALGMGHILVQDQGMGIGPALLPHIFKPFFSSNRGTGHGLGLAFCKQVVHSSGGTIEVRSEFAVGAAFMIVLPVATDTSIFATAEAA